MRIRVYKQFVKRERELFLSVKLPLPMVLMEILYLYYKTSELEHFGQIISSGNVQCYESISDTHLKIDCKFSHTILCWLIYCKHHDIEVLANPCELMEHFDSDGFKESMWWRIGTLFKRGMTWNEDETDAAVKPLPNEILKSFIKVSQKLTESLGTMPQ
jgi:hypothetical protein